MPYVDPRFSFQDEQDEADQGRLSPETSQDGANPETTPCPISGQTATRAEPLESGA
jgi:hypothetical protein